MPSIAKPAVAATALSLLLIGAITPVSFAQTGDPAIAGIAPSVLLPGQTFTITGSGFNWSVSAPDINDTVQIGTINCPIERWSNNQIVAMVPSDATSGSVTVTADQGTSAAYPVTIGASGIDVLYSTGTVNAMLGAANYGNGSSVGAVQIVPTPDHRGYWILEDNGTLQSFGDAINLSPASPVTGAVGFAVNASGDGGWILSQTGTVTPVGQATAGTQGSGSAVAIAPYGASGYAVLQSNGSITSSNGTTWNSGVNNPKAFTVRPAGGFWVLDSNGTVSAVDGAPSFNSSVNGAVAIASTPDGGGYYVLSGQGSLSGFGDAVLPPPGAAGPSSGTAVSLAVTGAATAYGTVQLDYWYPPGNLNNYLSSIQPVAAGHIHIMSPHWFWINLNDGSVGTDSTVNATVIAQMQAHGVKVVPMFGQAFNGSLGPLASASSQTAMVQNIMNAVQQWNLDGVNIDFEGLPNNSAGYLDTFIEKLKAALGPNRILVVDVFPDWTSFTNSQGVQVPGNVDTIYNYHYLSAFANYLVIMAYPLNFNPGPLSPLPWDQAILNYAKSVADPNKILLGIPAYGITWSGTSGNGNNGDTTVPVIEQVLSQNNAPVTYNATDGESTANYSVPFKVPPAMQPGSDSGQVVFLQWALNRVLQNPTAYAATSTKGTATLPLSLSGNYGSHTQAAVAAFQTDWGVTGDAPGVYGANTASKLSWIQEHYPQALVGGIPQVAWFEDGQGNAAHIALARQNGIAGVAVWSLGEQAANYFQATNGASNYVGNANLDAALSVSQIPLGASRELVVTVTEANGRPVPGLGVSLLGAASTTDAQGQALLSVSGSATGSFPLVVTDLTGTELTLNGAPGIQVGPTTTISRLYGNDRYLTANALASSAYTHVDTVILARSDLYPDALAGATLAHKLGVPILLVNSQSLNSETANALTALNPSHVILLGGTAAISQAVQTTLSKMGMSVTRYYGADRFGTADAIAQVTGAASGTAVVATGYNYTDALSVAPIAASQGWPLFLAGTNASAPLPQETLDTMKSMGIHQVYVIGSTTTIPDTINSQLATIGATEVRVGGQTDNAYATNLAVIQQFATVTKPATIFVATGNDFADALTASPIAALSDSPILLVDGTGSLTSQQTAWLTAERSSVHQVTIAGGTAAVTAALQQQIASLLP